MPVDDSKKLYEEIRIQIHEEGNDRISDQFLERIANLSVEEQAKIWLKIGLEYHILLKYKKAEQVYNRVTNEDFKKWYAIAQWGLGIVYKQLERFEESEKAFKRVTREDSKEHYSKAQTELGILCEKLERYKESEQAFKRVTREDSKEDYAKAQVNLGILCEKLERYEECEQAFTRVNRVDSKEWYAVAQSGLGILYQQLERYEECEQTFKRVTREDSTKWYATAQWTLAFLDSNQLKPNSLKYLRRILVTDDAETYAQAQFKLGQYYQSEAKLKQVIEHWEKIKLSHSEPVYEQVRYSLYILQKIKKLTSPNLHAKWLKIYTLVHEIINSLSIDDQYENEIAHYTRADVAKILLVENMKNFEKFSPLRLATIDLMNDPKEGLLLNECLILDAQQITTDDKAFVGCFTFHHDSLNQFRLYGKNSEQKEATGVSLVIDQDYFDLTSNMHHIRTASSASSELIKAVSSSMEEIQDKDQAEAVIKEQVDLKQKNQQSEVMAAVKTLQMKLPLYRCIYLDPDSGLVKVAHREEWTFCRKEKSDESKDWEAYFKNIQVIERSCNIQLKELKNLVAPLYKAIANDFPKNQKQAELLAELLLPLRYLIKHMAFKEEQECRIIYVTQWNDSQILYDADITKRFYINYSQDMVKYLKKIYLAPYAAGEKNMFEYIAAHAKENKRTENDVKVRLSHNPFRQF